MTVEDHYATAMRRKRWQLAWLVITLLLVMFVVYRGMLGWAGIPIALVTIVVGPVLANLLLTCPKCKERLASVFDKGCARCGARLSDDPDVHPVSIGPEATNNAAAYMAKSRQILARWAPIRRALNKSLYIVAVLAPIGLTVFLLNAPEHHDFAESAGIGVFVGLVLTGVWWLVLTHVVDTAFGLAFFAIRGRCPLCRKWFNPPASFGPGSLTMDFALPRFCPSCRSALE